LRGINSNLVYISRCGTGTGDAGDKYVGLDRFGRIVDQKWVNGSGTSVDEYQYTYDHDSNVLTKVNVNHTQNNETYTYDNLNRLTSANRNDGTANDQTWALDALGNQTSVTTNGTTVNRTSNSENQLTTVGGSTLSYDENGNMTVDDQGHTLIYDAWNRLVAVEDGEGHFIKGYTYDGLGRRVQEITVSDTVTMTRDGYFSAGGQLLETYVEDGKQERKVYSPIYTNAVLVRDMDTDSNGSLDQRVYFTSDANFNVTSVISASGTVLQHQMYTAYGEIAWLNASWSSIGNDAYAVENLFQGMRYDRDIGWYVTSNRLYRASLAYWNRVDPAGYVDGANAMVPFRCNPVNRTDPNGTWTWGSVAKNFAIGLAVGALVAAFVIVAAPVAIGVLGAGLMAGSAIAGVGISAATATAVATTAVTAGLAATAAYSIGKGAVDTYKAAKSGDMDSVAYNIGNIAGALAVGGFVGGPRATLGSAKPVEPIGTGPINSWEVGGQGPALPYEGFNSWEVPGARPTIQSPTSADGWVTGAQWNEYFGAKNGTSNVTWQWPGNMGYVYGADTYSTLEPGLIDRFGPESGTFVSPYGTPLEMRSLRPGTDLTLYNVYQVVEPIPGVRMGPIAPAFDQPGYGMQMKLPKPLSNYLRAGVIVPYCPK